MPRASVDPPVRADDAGPVIEMRQGRRAELEVGDETVAVVRVDQSNRIEVCASSGPGSMSNCRNRPLER